ncbi:DUF4787 domain-containing protein [archaeon]|nr:MAG: DUF4787 domain-containing protein [archaeon]
MIGIALLLLFLCLMVVSEAAPNKDKAWRLKKVKCEKEDCSHLVPEEAYNCVNKCTSEKCYNEVYKESPLEDGEIDNARNRAFLSCLREEVRLEKREKANASANVSYPRFSFVNVKRRALLCD